MTNIAHKKIVILNIKSEHLKGGRDYFKKYTSLKFQVLVASNMKNTAFWDIARCRVI
jgi:hypothetical protein